MGHPSGFIDHPRVSYSNLPVDERVKTWKEFNIPVSEEVPGSEFCRKVDLVLLAMGFVHVAHGKIIEELGVEYDPRGARDRGGRGRLLAPVSASTMSWTEHFQLQTWGMLITARQTGLNWFT